MKELAFYIYFFKSQNYEGNMCTKRITKSGTHKACNLYPNFTKVENKEHFELQTKFREH